MLQWWQNRQQRRLAAQALYTITMVAARRPSLYTQYAVPDTFDGRFDCVILHAAPIFTRLHDIATPESLALAQTYFDVIFRHMEISLREIGVGDLGVPRHVKNMMMATQGRCLAYGQALQAQDMNALTTALQKNLYASSPADTAQIEAIAHMLLTAYNRLSAMDLDKIRQADFHFPNPGEDKCLKAA